MDNYTEEIRKEMVILLFEHIKKEMEEPSNSIERQRLPQMIELLIALIR